MATDAVMHFILQHFHTWKYLLLFDSLAKYKYWHLYKIHTSTSSLVPPLLRDFRQLLPQCGNGVENMDAI